MSNTSAIKPVPVAFLFLLFVFLPLGIFGGLWAWDSASAARKRSKAESVTTDAIPVKGLRQIFKAGFEEPVTIESGKFGTEAWLRGDDAFGYSWNKLDHVFELVAPESFDNLVNIELDKTRAFDGKRSLHMRQNLAELGTQARLQFFGDDTTFKNEIFTRRYYFIPSSNLKYLTEDDQSASIGGTREQRGPGLGPGGAGLDFSMPLYAVRRGSRFVFAQAIVDYSAGKRWSDWTRAPKGLVTYGASTTVPLDRWFRLDTYVLRDKTKGKIRVWLDGKPIFDLQDVRTKNSSDRWFTKLADVDTDPAPFELWADNVEIWTR